MFQRLQVNASDRRLYSKIYETDQMRKHVCCWLPGRAW